MAFRPRGRGRGRGYQGNGFNPNFRSQQQDNEGDQAMFDANASRGRGRGGRGGYQGNNFNPNYRPSHQQQQPDSEGDQAMNDANFRSRGRGQGRGRGPRGGHNHFQQSHQHNEQADQGLNSDNPAVQLMKDFLGRRYDASNKLLNLSAIATDEPVRDAGMFATEATQKKFFPALMVVCEDILGSQQAKEEAIESVTLCANNLENTHAVYKLCWQLNHIKNLDLSNNNFATVDALRPWKGRFKNIEHLIIDPFPGNAWQDEITSWYPTLKILNGVQVRPARGARGATDNGASTPTLQNNTNMQVAPVDAEQQKKEEMILYVQQQTNLKRDYALQCLEAANWNIEQAGVLFTQSQPTLPPDAYN